MPVCHVYLPRAKNDVIVVFQILDAIEEQEFGENHQPPAKHQDDQCQKGPLTAPIIVRDGQQQL